VEDKTVSFQIKSVILYKEGYKPRVVDFKEGVNIISGDPNTGKSTLIHILDYCLGRSVFGVYAGVTRQTVAWYAVLLQINDTQVFIAKPSPSPGSSSYSLVHFEVNTKIDIPRDSRNLEAKFNSREVTLQMFNLMHSAPFPYVLT
jgi:AAA15 family ATPase/GTPase